MVYDTIEKIGKHDSVGDIMTMTDRLISTRLEAVESRVDAQISNLATVVDSTMKEIRESNAGIHRNMDIMRREIDIMRSDNAEFKKSMDAKFENFFNYFDAKLSEHRKEARNWAIAITTICISTVIAVGTVNYALNSNLIDSFSQGIVLKDAITQEVTKQNEQLTGQYNNLSTRFDDLSGRVDDLSVRVDDLSTKVQGISDNLESNNVRLDYNNARLDKLLERLGD